jgi:uncharacterized protein (DUF1684 family)
MLVRSLHEFWRYYGDTLKVECPTGSGRMCNLNEVGEELTRRLSRIFLRDPARGDRRAVFDGNDYFQNDPHWRDHIPFHEYFNGDNGAGLGASHQTGWTGAIAALMHLSTRTAEQALEAPRGVRAGVTVAARTANTR